MHTVEHEWELHVAILDLEETIRAFDRVQRGGASANDVKRVQRAMTDLLETSPDDDFTMEAARQNVERAHDQLCAQSVLHRLPVAN
ncbi:hypothetical protein GOP80_07845 [Planococcaceae bacterium Storch 2/2-2]|nr:hypothetical protein [Planococcaceae bacterium Storch 2/2-2]